MPNGRIAAVPSAVVIVVGLVLASCGSDDVADAPPTPVEPVPTITASPVDTVDDQMTETTSSAPGTPVPTPDPPATTTAPTTPASTSTVASDDAGDDGVAPVCAAFEGLFIAGLVSSFAAFDDPAVIDPLLLAFMPAVSSRFEAAVDALPVDGVSAEFEQTLRDVSAVFTDAADAVRAAGVTDAEVARLGSVLDPELLGAGPADDDVGDLIDDDVLDRLAAVDFDLDDALVDVPEPDEAQLASLCPSIAEFLGVDSATIEDACSLVDEVALGVVFAEPYPSFDPDDVGTGMCVWEDTSGDRELVVSVTDQATVDGTRAGNEQSLDVLAIDGLGDEAWVIDGLLSGTSGTGGRGGFGAGRATVGVVEGSRGVLVAVRAADDDPAALATDVATILFGG